MSSQKGDGRHRLAAVAAVACALALAGISAIIAYRFGEILGSSSFDKRTLGWLGVVIGVCKIVLPFGLYAAWRQGRAVAFAGGLAALVCFVAYSLSSSFGYAASQRNLSERESANLSQLSSDLSSLKARPSAAIQPLIDVAKDKSERAKLKSELAIALERERLRNVVMSDDAESAAPQIEALSTLTTWSRDQVRSRQMGLASVCIDLGEILMFYIASLLWWGVPAPTDGGRKLAPPTIDTVADEDVGAPKEKPAAPDQRRNTTTRAWIENLLATGADINPTDAYAVYKAHWSNRRRKPIAKSRFSKMLEAVARELGAERSSAAGRLVYRKAA